MGHKDNIFSMILYGNGKIPKYFELDKESIKFIVIIFPAITVFTIIILISTIIYFKHQQSSIPIVHAETRDVDSDEVMGLKEEIKDLNLRLSSIDAPPSSEISIFRYPINVAEANNPDAIGDFAVTHHEAGLNVSFKIMNTVPDDKTTGYAYVLLAYDGTYVIYPRPKSNDFALDYRDGLSFSVSIFRPVDIEFPLPTGKYELKIFIFSRNGELIAWKKYGN